MTWSVFDDEDVNPVAGPAAIALPYLLLTGVFFVDAGEVGDLAGDFVAAGPGGRMPFPTMIIT